MWTRHHVGLGSYALYLVLLYACCSSFAGVLVLVLSTQLLEPSFLLWLLPASTQKSIHDGSTRYHQSTSPFPSSPPSSHPNSMWSLSTHPYYLHSPNTLSLSYGPGSLADPCCHKKILTVLIISVVVLMIINWYLSNWCDMKIANTVADGQASQARHRYYIMTLIWQHKIKKWNLFERVTTIQTYH